MHNSHIKSESLDYKVVITSILKIKIGNRQ